MDKQSGQREDVTSQDEYVAMYGQTVRGKTSLLVRVWAIREAECGDWGNTHVRFGLVTHQSARRTSEARGPRLSLFWALRVRFGVLFGTRSTSLSLGNTLQLGNRNLIDKGRQKRNHALRQPHRGAAIVTGRGGWKHAEELGVLVPLARAETVVEHEHKSRGGGAGLGDIAPPKRGWDVTTACIHDFGFVFDFAKSRGKLKNQKPFHRRASYADDDAENHHDRVAVYPRLVGTRDYSVCGPPPAVNLDGTVAVRGRDA